MLIKDMTRDSDGNLPAYAWPGGYTIVYYCDDGEPMCADCATEFTDNPFDDERDNPKYGETYDEGPTLNCSQCYTELESSYGEVEYSE